jgi:CRISPR-associated endonuclease/helicase Cas3
MLQFFRRVRCERAGLLTDEQLASRLSEEKQALCIVNNRRQAKDVYGLLEKDGSFHLSTMMYPEHRRRVLEEIRGRLAGGSACRVVSTSLVEAGVDVDFPAVYRSLAGLDSIIQAAGRCNREGRRSPDESVVHIFESERKAPDILNQNISAAKRVMRSYEDFSSPEAVNEYFSFLYYTLKDDKSLDSKGILPMIEGGSMPFASVADAFRIIDGLENTLYIPCGEGAELCGSLEKYGPNRSLMRKLGSYSVGVFRGHFNELVKSGAAKMVSDNSAVLRDLSLYSKETGLAFGFGGGLGLFTDEAGL